jgi:cellulose synthase/poly-beta-1,6-N-acetylglucosamine synthase-like glycosyltransferase
LLQVIVVDSGSNDGTADAVKAFMTRSDLCVTLVVESERHGKAAAINHGLDRATAEIVVVTDAPARFEPSALADLARCFADPRVGAATGYFVVTGEAGPLQRTEDRFWRIRNALRQWRRKSTPRVPFR